MPAYKIYRLDAVGGRSTGKEITCKTDAGAMQFAQTMVKGSARAEVWSGEHLLGTAYAKIILMEKSSLRLKTSA